MYIHRLGRTGRAGKKGSGLLVLLPFETGFLDKEKREGNLRLLNNSGDDRNFTNTLSSDHKDKMERAVQLIRSGHKNLLSSAEVAYQSFVAYYIERPEFKKSQPQGQEKLLEIANEFSRSTGLARTPHLSESLLLSKMKKKR